MLKVFLELEVGLVFFVGNLSCSLSCPFSLLLMILYLLSLLYKFELTGSEMLGFFNVSLFFDY